MATIHFTRFTLFMLLILSAMSALSNDLASSVGDLAAAYAIQCEDPKFFIIAALSTIPKMRFLGLIGFLLMSVGKTEAGKIFLGLHFGTIGIDDASLPILGRLSSAAAGLSLAM